MRQLAKGSKVQLDRHPRSQLGSGLVDTGSRSGEGLIEVRGGFFAIVDPDIVDELKKYSWCIHRKANGHYVHVYRNEQRKDGRWRRIKLTHHVMGLPKAGCGWDHANGNNLDNRRCNLREATQRQNSQNMRVRRIHNRQRPKTSKYKGVSFSLIHKRYIPTKPWRSRIRLNGELINIGWFKTEEEAAIAYNNAASKYFGEFACLNEVS